MGIVYLLIVDICYEVCSDDENIFLKVVIEIIAQAVESLNSVFKIVSAERRKDCKSGTALGKISLSA